jgi:hypothetical protein
MRQTLHLRNGRRLRVGPGWSHDPYRIHYRITMRQAVGVRPEDIPLGVVLHIAAQTETDCPHCKGGHAQIRYEDPRYKENV